MIRDSNPDRRKGSFISRMYADRLSVHSVSYSNDNWQFFAKGKSAQVNLSLASSAEAKNEWRCTSTLLLTACTETLPVLFLTEMLPEELINVTILGS
jgi:hypothetical protein